MFTSAHPSSSLPNTLTCLRTIGRSGEDFGPKGSFYSLLSVRMSLLAAVVDIQTETKAFFSFERKTPRVCCHISHQNAEMIRKEFKNAAREH